MKVLITGASGFVGQNLLAYLKNDEVSVMTRGELLNPTIENFDVVIHLAGKAHDLKNSSDSDAYFAVNYELTKKLFDAFLISDAKKFIFLSSVKAAADVVSGVLTEEIDPDPKTAYGKSKLKAEEYLLNQPLPEGKSYFILRPCMIHGPGNKGNLNLLYKFVQKGIPYPLAAFHNKRSYLSVQNLCFIIHQLMQTAVPSGIYQVADDEALSTNEVVGILAGSLNRNPRLWAIPKSMISNFAALGDLLKLPLNTERLEKLTENYIVSNQKIKKALNLPLPFSSRDGLRHTAASFTHGQPKSLNH